MAEKWAEHAPSRLEVRLLVSEDPDPEQSSPKACPKILRLSRPSYDRTSLTNSRKVTFFGPFFQNPARAESTSGPTVGRSKPAPLGISMKTLPQTLGKIWPGNTHTVLPDPESAFFQGWDPHFRSSTRGSTWRPYYWSHRPRTTSKVHEKRAPRCTTRPRFSQ